MILNEIDKIDCEFKELLKSEEIVKNEKQNLMINQEQMERMMRNPTGVLNSNHSRRWSIMLYLNHIIQNPKKQIVSLWFFLKVIDMFYELLDNTQQKIIAILSNHQLDEPYYSQGWKKGNK